MSYASLPVTRELRRSVKSVDRSQRGTKRSHDHSLPPHASNKGKTSENVASDHPHLPSWDDWPTTIQEMLKFPGLRPVLRQEKAPTWRYGPHCTSQSIVDRKVLREHINSNHHS